MKLPFNIGSEPIQGNFDALVGALGARSIQTGNVNLTFTASATSATANVAHGLGVQPVAVFFTPFDINIDNVAVTAWNSTIFTAQARYTGVVTGTAAFGWMAIG